MGAGLTIRIPDRYASLYAVLDHEYKGQVSLHRHPCHPFTSQNSLDHLGGQGYDAARDGERRWSWCIVGLGKGRRGYAIVRSWDPVRRSEYRWTTDEIESGLAELEHAAWNLTNGDAEPAIEAAEQWRGEFMARSEAERMEGYRRGENPYWFQTPLSCAEYGLIHINVGTVYLGNRIEP